MNKLLKRYFENGIYMFVVSWNIKIKLLSVGFLI